MLGLQGECPPPGPLAIIANAVKQSAEWRLPSLPFVPTLPMR
jgi:hypothetical protein